MTRFEMGLTGVAVLLGIGALAAAVTDQAGYEFSLDVFEGPADEPDSATSTADSRSAAPAVSAVAAPLAASAKPLDAYVLPVPKPSESQSGGIEAKQTLLLWVGKSDAFMGTLREVMKAGPKVVTRFLTSGDKVISSLPGQFIAVDNELYRWETRTRSLPRTSCEYMGSQGKHPYSRRLLREAGFVSVRSGRRLVVAKFLKDDIEELPYDEVHTAIAFHGDTLFLRSDREFYQCGIHPLYETEFRVARLSHGQLEEVDANEIRPAGLTRMRSAISLLGEDTFNGGIPKVTMVFPEFQTTGPQWMAQYTIGAPWAQSDGYWGGYSQSQRLELPGVPLRLANLGAAPEAVARYVREHADEQVYGYSIGKNLARSTGPSASGATSHRERRTGPPTTRF